MTFAKGVTSGYIPLGGVMVGDRVAKVLIDQGGEFNHGYTYSGHPVACAVALANIRLIRRERWSSACATTSALPGAALRRTGGPIRWSARRRPRDDGRPAAGEGQGLGHGLRRALEVGMVCRGHCFGNGLIMRAVGDRMIIARRW